MVKYSSNSIKCINLKVHKFTRQNISATKANMIKYRVFIQDDNNVKQSNVNCRSIQTAVVCKTLDRKTEQKQSKEYQSEINTHERVLNKNFPKHIEAKETKDIVSLRFC